MKYIAYFEILDKLMLRFVQYNLLIFRSRGMKWWIHPRNQQNYLAIFFSNYYFVKNYKFPNNFLSLAYSMIYGINGFGLQPYFYEDCILIFILHRLSYSDELSLVVSCLFNRMHQIKITLLIKT